MNKANSILFDKNVVEFTAVAVETCAFLENADAMSREEFVDKLLKLLPLLYLKTSLLPHVFLQGDGYLEECVTEEIYSLLRMKTASVLAEKDDYLEVFNPEIQYSDTPMKKCISEDLADIYQDLKNFTFLFEIGLDETRNDALVRCKENFSLFWGQRLVNTLRALHDVKYDTTNPEDVSLPSWDYE